MKIIAEVGSNIKSLEDCKAAISDARLCGADAVKFQCFSKKDLYGYGSDQRMIEIDWVKDLVMRCHTEGIEFMCSAFSVDAYEAINPFVRVHKIASAEMTDPDILKKVRSFLRPVVLSTAGSEFPEIKKALDILNGIPVTIMYCVGDYPAKIIDLTMITRIKQAFGPEFPVGYSDHSIDVLNIPMMAKKYGCSVLEKHFNPSDYSDTPDCGHSLNCAEFTLMTRNLNGTMEHKDPARLSNFQMKSHYKRRVVATVDIEIGARLKKGVNYDFFRLTTSSKIKQNQISTFDHMGLDGITVRKKIDKWDQISFDDL